MEKSLCSSYEVNQNLIYSWPSLTKKEIEKSKEMLEEFKSQSDCFMLLNNELHYYTVFLISDAYTQQDKFSDVLIEVLEDLSLSIKSIEKTEFNTIEIWLIDKNNKSRAFYLFDYSGGLIECQ